MRLKLVILLFTVILLQCDFGACYRTEVEITPAPETEEPTTKKSGFFGGIKNFFRGSATTTTTTVAPEVTTAKNAQLPAAIASDNKADNRGVQKPPPLTIPHAPLMPLGPRPDTPPSTPLSGNRQEEPQWPKQQPNNAPASAGSNFKPIAPAQQSQPQQFGQGGAQPFGTGSVPAQPSYPPGFAPYRPPKQQPSGLDLSYGGGAANSGQNNNRQHGFGLAPLTSSTTTSTTTTTTTTTQKPGMQFDMRSGMDTPATSTTQRTTTAKEDFPALPRRPSAGAKEDFPALPAPKSPTPAPAPSPVRPQSPSAWNVPLPTPATQPTRPTTPGQANAGGDRVAFVPHSPGSTTTVRPGFQSTGNSVANDAEIEALTEQLYQKEVNSQLSYIQVNVQGKTRSIDSGDEAPKPLLEVNEKALESPAIAKMRLLFNNYEMDTLVNEHVTPNERKEENDFLDSIMNTAVMRQAMLFLQNKGIVTPDPRTHRELVKELWFTQYSRGSGKIGSSGFEHVFVNEVKNGTIIGLHNWVYFYEEEKAGRLDYKGYIKQVDLGTKGKVLKVRFTHNGNNKPVNTLFIGTSPELELALYTVCFQLRPDRTCPVSMGNSKFGIVTYSWRYRGKNLIGSAYPEV